MKRSTYICCYLKKHFIFVSSWLLITSAKSKLKSFKLDANLFLVSSYLLKTSEKLKVSISAWPNGCVRLRNKWFWVRVQFESLHLQILRLLRARSSLTFMQLKSVDSLWTAYVAWQEHTVQLNLFVISGNLSYFIFLLFWKVVSVI